MVTLAVFCSPVVRVRGTATPPTYVFACVYALGEDAKGVSSSSYFASLEFRIRRILPYFIIVRVFHLTNDLRTLRTSLGVPFATGTRFVRGKRSTRKRRPNPNVLPIYT